MTHHLTLGLARLRRLGLQPVERAVQALTAQQRVLRAGGQAVLGQRHLAGRPPGAHDAGPARLASG